MLNRTITISVAKNNSRTCPANRKYFELNIYHLNDLAKVIAEKSWSPIVWREGRRLSDNFVSCGLMVYDFDSGEISMRNAMSVLEARGLAYVAGTSKSHLIEKGGLPPRERFRIVCPIESDIKEKIHYGYAVRKYLSMFPTADKATKDGARQWLPCREIVKVFEGGHLSAIEFSERDRERVSEYLNHDVNLSARFIPQWARQIMEKGVEPGKRNITAFNISLALTRNGMSEDEIFSLFSRSNIGLGSSEVRHLIKSSRSYVYGR